MAIVTVDDLEEFIDVTNPIKAQAMIDDATAIAVLAAPCLAAEGDLTAQQIAAFKAVLRGAIIRWNDTGSGAVQSQTVGPFSQTLDTRQQRRGMFWPSEIEQLQNICKGEDDGAFSIDTVPTCSVTHADICAINFGANYCSCGAILTGLYALYERNPC